MKYPINSFFVFGAPRSGTTFMSELFNIANNAKVYSEQSPKLGYESRQKHLGNFKSYEDSKNFMRIQKQEMISLVNELGYIYGDKNMNFLPFLNEMHDIWKNSRFVFTYRDGRDAISSMYNWSLQGKNFFKMKEDIGNEEGTKLPIHDMWDYSRMRPKKGEKFYDTWGELNHFQKLCVYWDYYNRYALNVINDLGKDRFFFVNNTSFDEKDYKELFDFLYLDGYDELKCKALIDTNVNTSNLNNKSKFPSWNQWDKEQRDFYEKIVGDTHRMLLGKLTW